jgi:hypothetical protein
MDTSKEYIDMCSKADEIQSLKKYEVRIISGFVAPKINDTGIYDREWIAFNGNEPEIWCEQCAQEFSYGLFPPVVWLPKQDQLQDMCYYSDSPPSVIHQIHDFMESRYPPNVSDEDWQLAEMVFETWEQIWLAFVMKEKYQKTWDGNNWVKE